MRYAMLDTNMQVKEFRDLDPAWVQTLINAGNPKATYIRPFVQDAEPPYNTATQELEFGGYVVEANQVRGTWSVRNLTQEEIADRNRKTWTSYEFLLRLTAEERAAIRTMAQVNQGVADFLHLSQAAQEVVSDDPMTLAGMNYMVSIGIFTEQRKNEILGLI
jgi:hypothetical protein